MSEWLERIVSNHLSSVEQESLLARAEKAEAALQRVREMHTIDQCPRCAEFHCLECGCEGVYTEQVSCRTTRAIEGEL